MKKYIALAILMYSIPALSAGEDIGKEISLASSNGGAAFGVQFAHDSDFGINGYFTVNGQDLTGGNCFTSLAYRFYNSTTGAYISDWTIQDYDSSCAQMTGTYPIHVSTADTVVVKNILSQLPNLELVLAVNFWGTQYKATNFIDLGSLCKTSPENFADLTTGKTGCDVQL